MVKPEQILSTIKVTNKQIKTYFLNTQVRWM